MAPIPHIRSFSLQQTRPSQTTALVRHRNQLTSVPYGSQSQKHIYSTDPAPETKGQLRKGGGGGERLEGPVHPQVCRDQTPETSAMTIWLPKQILYHEKTYRCERVGFHRVLPLGL